MNYFSPLLYFIYGSAILSGQAKACSACLVKYKNRHELKHAISSQHCHKAPCQGALVSYSQETVAVSILQACPSHLTNDLSGAS